MTSQLLHEFLKLINYSWGQQPIQQFRQQFSLKKQNNSFARSSGGSRPSDKGGGGSSRPWDKGGRASKKKLFRPFGPHFRLKIRRGGPPSPGSATACIKLLMEHVFDISIHYTGETSYSNVLRRTGTLGEELFFSFVNSVNTDLVNNSSKIFGIIKLKLFVISQRLKFP